MTVSEPSQVQGEMGRLDVTPHENLVMQAENMIAAWDRLYTLINPRSSFPLGFADLAEDTEFREVQWLRSALSSTRKDERA